jgi:hypothetical protein
MNTAALRVDVAVAVEIASAYLDAPSTRSPLAEAAYARLALETDRLFAAITWMGGPDAVRVRFSTCAQLYDIAEELFASVRGDRLLEITAARTDHDRKHPLFDCAVGGAFDRFRAVHDILGHARLGAGFDRHGEYATWLFQERFHTRLAATSPGDRPARQAQRLLDNRRAAPPQGDPRGAAAAAAVEAVGRYPRRDRVLIRSRGCDWGVPRTRPEQSGATVAPPSNEHPLSIRPATGFST